MEFNINHIVRVKLTDSGRRIYARNEDENGWSTWQLRDLMMTFGKHVCIGFNEGPFETVIDIPIPTPNKAPKMAVPRDTNPKPLPIGIGEKAYYAMDGCVVTIIDRHEDQQKYDSGLGYLIVANNEIQWVCSSWFWRLEVIEDINRINAESGDTK